MNIMLLYKIQARTKKNSDSSDTTNGRTVRNLETEIQAFREPPASDWLAIQMPVLCVSHSATVEKWQIPV